MRNIFYTLRVGWGVIAGLFRRLGFANIGLSLGLVAVLGAPFIPAPHFAAVLPLGVAVGWLFTAKLWARLRYGSTVDRATLAGYNAGLMSLVGVALGVAALRIAAPGLGALASDSWDGVRSALAWLPNVPFEMVLLTIAMVGTVATVVATVLVGLAAGEAAVKDDERALTENEVLLEDLASVLDVDEKILFEASMNKALLVNRHGGGSVDFTLPQKLRKKLRDRQLLDDQVALYMPTFEVFDASTRYGTLALIPVSDETDALRANLEANNGVTSDDVTFDFGEAGDEVERIDFGM